MINNQNNNNNNNNNDSDIESDIDTDSHSENESGSDNEEMLDMANTVSNELGKLNKYNTFEESSAATALLVFGLFAKEAAKVTPQNPNTARLEVTEKIADLFLHALDLNELKKDEENNQVKKENG